MLNNCLSLLSFVSHQFCEKQKETIAASSTVMSLGLTRLIVIPINKHLKGASCPQTELNLRY